MAAAYQVNITIAAGVDFAQEYTITKPDQSPEDITGYNITNYYMSMSHLEFLQEMLVGKPMVRYNKHVNRLYLDTDPGYL